MEHSITIGDKHTWNDWHLTPRSRPVINPPAVKTNYVEIKGGDGVIDLTDALVGRPLYKNRSGSLEFVVENDFKPWASLYSEIMNYVHGRSLKIILDDDPGYYYAGRVAVNVWKSDEYYSSIVLDYDLAPYKIEVVSTLDEWVWDTFNFLTGVIKYYKDLQVNGSLNVSLVGSQRPTPISVIASAPMSLTFQGYTYPVAAGASIIRDAIIENGIQNLLVTGNGTISIVYSGGSL